MNRIDALFSRLRSEGRRALMPFLTAGDPNLETTMALVRNCLGAAGAHLVELGIPYSDPIADGPVIAASYNRALLHGIKLDAILSGVHAWRQETGQDPKQKDAPLVTMVSFSIVHRHGVDRYVSEAAAAGVDGLIVPDLPIEEAEKLEKRVAAEQLKLIQLVTPTTPKERAIRIAKSSTGFLYYVSVAGITGERTQLPPDLADKVGWLRSQTDIPICIGFGISKPEHVRQLAPVADGLIIGSAIVRRIHDLNEQGASREAVVQDVGQFVAEMVKALG